jgi:hypothetical protein
MRTVASRLPIEAQVHAQHLIVRAGFFLPGAPARTPTLSPSVPEE